MVPDWGSFSGTGFAFGTLGLGGSTTNAGAGTEVLRGATGSGGGVMLGVVVGRGPKTGISSSSGTSVIVGSGAITVGA